jgi:putative Ca2+/H+ antiporter (TMEM165/GDT1 family)
MDYKLLWATFVFVFMAELGDKTQLATFCISAGCRSKISIFLGAASALVLSSLIAVLFGEAVSRIIPPPYLRISAGILFIAVGIWTIFFGTKGVCP